MNNYKKLRVAHYVGVLGEGGIEKFVLNLQKYIFKYDIIIDFIVDYNVETRYDDIISSYGGRKQAIFPYKTKRQSIFRKLNKVVLMYKLFKKNEYSILHFHNSYQTTMFYGLVAKLSGIKNRIIHSHSTGYGNKSILFKFSCFISKFLFKSSYNIFYADSYNAGVFMFGKKTSFEVIKMGINLDRFSFNYNSRQRLRTDLTLGDRLVVGHVGRFEFAKNHSFVLDIFYELLKANKDAVLLLVGAGSLEESIRSKALRMDIHRSIIFYGVTDDVPMVMSAMDILLLPSISEGLGIVAIEAQSCGLPVLASTTVPKECQITPIIRFMSIDDQAEQWANEVIKVSNMNEITIDMSLSLTLTDYNIDEISLALSNSYFKISD
jgi:glycosyltransferase involved in cell wall biosynthesis